jgi:predicted ester cyclase
MDAFGNGAIDVIDECVHEHVVDHGALPGAPTGRDGVKASVGIVRQALPDIRFTIRHVIEQDDLVVLHWEAVGTHTGPFMGEPASGSPVSISGIEIDRYEGDQIVEVWEQRDMLGFLTQIGALPKAP